MGTQKEKLIYFVEDNEMFAIPVKMGLEKMGYEVCYFHSGEEMFENFDLKPDVIVLDYMLESEFASAKNGKEIILAVNEKKAGIPVVVLSSIEDVNEIDKLLKIGASDFIPKGENFFESLILTLKYTVVVERLNVEIGELRRYLRFYKYSFILALGMLLVFLLWV